MEVSAAEKYLNVKKIKVLKRIGVPHLAFERGVKGRGPPEYWSYEYVYCLAKAPDGWVASTEYDISLADWCKLCDHYSHNENRISPSGEFKDLFEKYTGCEASAANINLAYNDNVLVSPSDLPQKAAKVVTPPKKTKVAGTKKKVTDKKKVAASRKVKCRGFQSKVVTAYAKKDTNYLIKAGWAYFGDCWRHRNCTLDQDVNEYDRCPSCDNANKHMQKSRHPMLFDIHSADKDCALLPGDAAIATFICQHTNSIAKGDVPTDQNLANTATILKLKGMDRIEFGSLKKQVFLVCSMCDQHRICNKRGNLKNICRKCQSTVLKQKERDAKREKDYDNRVDPTSKIGFDKLTPEEVSVRLKKANNLRRTKSKALQRLKDKLELSNDRVTFSEELANEYLMALEEAIGPNRDDLNKSLQDVIFEAMKQEAEKGKNPIEINKQKDCQELINFVEESIRNMIHDLKGQKNQCRYSPDTMSLCMSLYLQAGPSAYQQYQDSNILVIPDATTLAEIKQKQNIKEGSCIQLYERQLLTRPTKLEIGQVMCDEMKLQKDIVINVKNGKIVGFTQDSVDMKKIINNLIDGKEIESFDKPATYVNQWLYRSINGRTYRCEFFYNDGSLTGDTLLKQFNQVVIRCELAGSIVLGMVCDAGGNNARLFKLLRGRAVLGEESWLDEELVCVENPYDPSRHICLFHCSTHDLKAMRNALFTSWAGPNGKKEFLDVDGTPISKEIIYNCMMRDKDRLGRLHKDHSDIKSSTYYLNRWSKMNAQEAKRVFSRRTLVELATFIFEKLGIAAEDIPTESKLGKIGYFSALAKVMKQKLKEASEQVRSILASDISTFEWLANVHEIFNARLLKMDELIHFGNIDE